MEEIKVGDKVRVKNKNAYNDYTDIGKVVRIFDRDVKDLKSQYGIKTVTFCLVQFFRHTREFRMGSLEKV